jgi:hypothetical protein
LLISRGTCHGPAVSADLARNCPLDSAARFRLRLCLSAHAAAAGSQPARTSRRPNWELCAVPCMQLYRKRPKRRDFFNRARKYAAMNEPVRCGRRGRWWDSSSRGSYGRRGVRPLSFSMPFSVRLFLMYILGSGVIGNKNLCFDDCRGAAHCPPSWACLPLGCTTVLASCAPPPYSIWLGLMGAVPFTAAAARGMFALARLSCKPGQAPYAVWACC